MTVFTESWYPPADLAVLAGLPNALPRGLAVEVGAWEGRSTLTLVRRLRRKLHVIDHWQGSAADGTDVYAEGRDVRAVFDANLARPLASGRVVVHEGDWRDVLPGVLNGPVAFAHLDAEHDTASVTGLLRLLLPHVAAGGMICGHDAHHPPTTEALDASLDGWSWRDNVWWWRAGT